MIIINFRYSDPKHKLHCCRKPPETAAFLTASFFLSHYVRFAVSVVIITFVRHDITSYALELHSKMLRLFGVVGGATKEPQG